MRCYRCGSVLSETDFCNSCGTDVAIYKRIIKLSNTYYNMGLEKAKVRDLSGAADILRRSVRMNKNNTQARNLLGLVYYEMGEFVEALGQWVISKNIQPDKNMADEYLKDAQSNPSKLEAMNMTIKKYNTALGYAMDGSDDLAIIQLKKVINLNPKFIKAYQLLALLHMKKEEYGRAKKLLDKSLKIDFNNTLSVRYLYEIECITDKIDNKKLKDEMEKRELSGNDVIIPETGYKDINYGVMQFVTIIIGILIGAAMVYFLITPAKENRAVSDYKETINEYSENISKLNLTLTEMQKNVDTLTSENEDLKRQVEEAGKQQEIDAIYTTLIEAALHFANEEAVECALKLMEIESTDGAAETFLSLYNSLVEKTYGKAYEEYYNQAYQAENSSRYQDAIDAFLICEKVQPENLEILYHIGRNYTMLNNGVANDTAKTYFNRIIELNPTSEFAGWSQQYVQ